MFAGAKQSATSRTFGIGFLRMVCAIRTLMPAISPTFGSASCKRTKAANPIHEFCVKYRHGAQIERIGACSRNNLGTILNIARGFTLGCRDIVHQYSIYFVAVEEFVAGAFHAGRRAWDNCEVARLKIHMLASQNVHACVEIGNDILDSKSVQEKSRKVIVEPTNDHVGLLQGRLAFGGQRRMLHDIDNNVTGSSHSA